jgi:hypothetical protein
MGRKSAFHVRSITYALLSASVIVCLILAPHCATRCAAQACTSSSPDGSSGACHRSSNNTGALEFSAVTSANPCATGEIVFTTPRLEQRAVSQKSSITPTFFSVSAPHLAAFLGLIHADDPSALTSGSSPGSAFVVFPSIPLRI